jgi:high-affinity iron transporter
LLGSLARYGERLEAFVSLVAIAVLLLILNWFYHRIYWNEHLAGLHGRKKRILRSGLVGAAGAQLLAVLFLQALVLEAGIQAVRLGVAFGLVGVGAVAVLTIALERKLPHKRLLVGTGVLILACCW